nr:sigma-70 family RNA polymerase sigma factor [Planctomycetota bacterium]
MPTATSVDSLAASLRRLAEGRDPEAWSAVVARQGDAIHGVCRRILRNGALADDAAQETLLALRDYARHFKPRSDDADGDARAWIARVAVTAALKVRRGEMRRQARERAAAREHAMSDGSDIPGSERMDEVLAALDSLPDRHRVPLLLHFVAGLDHERIAASLGTTGGNARVRVHRALTELRSKLGASVS